MELQSLSIPVTKFERIKTQWCTLSPNGEMGAMSQYGADVLLFRTNDMSPIAVIQSDRRLPDYWCIILS